MRGTTIYVGTRMIETRLTGAEGNKAKFEARVYQDVVSKGYTVALIHGSQKELADADEVVTRVHSCCVTSETLGARDCDCVEQLEGAMQRIVDIGKGILFFLYGASHEGRGASYICKARDRMHVQFSEETLNTYRAYELLGLNPEMRSFRVIADVAHCIGLDRTNWVMLTNNPDKIKAFHDNGLTVKRTERIDSRPTRFNIAYLRSKKAFGHDLERATKETSVYDAAGIKIVTPFEPYQVPGVPRYIHVASYYLPIGCMWGWMLLDEEKVATLEAAGVKVLSNDPLRGRRWVQIDTSTSPAPECGDFDAEDEEAVSGLSKEELAERTALKEARIVLDSAVYWWRANIYYDLVGSEEFLVLEYGDPGTDLSLGQPSPHVQQALARIRASDDAVRDAASAALAAQTAGGEAAASSSSASAADEAGEQAELIHPTEEELLSPDVQAAYNTAPMLRFHSESVFNRFPLVEQKEKDRYRRAIRAAVKAGWGMCTLFFHDGRGRGLGGNFVDAVAVGSVKDTRDFESAALLLGRHMRGSKKAKVLSSRRHESIRKALRQLDVTVTDWKYIGDSSLDKGHVLLRRRVEEAPFHVESMLEDAVPAFPVARRADSVTPEASAAFAAAGLPLSGPLGFSPAERVDPAEAEWVITGVGSSEAHARYLVSLIRRHTGADARFESLTAFVTEGGYGAASSDTGTDAAGATATRRGKGGRPRVLVVISQGLSPNSKTALRHMLSFDRVVLFTAVTTANREAKVAVLRAVAAHPGGGVVLHFPMEDEYGVLVRAVGPVCGFLKAYQAARAWCAPHLPDPEHIRPALKSAGKGAGQDPPRAVVEALIASARCVAKQALSEDTNDDDDEADASASSASPATPSARDKDTRVSRSLARQLSGPYGDIPTRSHPLSNVAIVASPPHTGYLLNVAKKFEEGMFLSTPTVDDFLSFPHGRHQYLLSSHRRSLRHNSRAQADAVVLILDSGSASDTRMAAMAADMTERELPTWRITSSLPLDLQIIEFELIVNGLMAEVAEFGGVDQCHWPGYDAESELYLVTA